MLNLIMGFLMLAPAGHAPGPPTAPSHGGPVRYVGNGINFGNNNNVSVICNGLCASIPGLSPSPDAPAPDAPAPDAPAPAAPAPDAPAPDAPAPDVGGGLFNPIDLVNGDSDDNHNDVNQDNHDNHDNDIVTCIIGGSFFGDDVCHS